MLHKIEELSLNAWPSLQTVIYDGWILRFAEGYTRRANSISPLYPSQMDLEEKVRHCEGLYGQQNLPVIFKLAGRDESGELDQYLGARGYHDEAYTSVQVADLNSWQAQVDSGLKFSDSLDDAWEKAFSSMHLLDNRQRQIHMRMVNSIVPPKTFVWQRKDEQIIGCALGVLQDGYLGIFDVIIDREFRGRGYGESLMRGLLSWGKTNEAHTAYLQVMVDNEPALGLYHKLGFREAYVYWYRVKE